VSGERRVFGKPGLQRQDQPCAARQDADEENERYRYGLHDERGAPAARHGGNHTGEHDDAQQDRRLDEPIQRPQNVDHHCSFVIARSR
jgi:hypothetical protein